MADLIRAVHIEPPAEARNHASSCGTSPHTLLVVDDSTAVRALIRHAVESQGLFGRIVEAKNGLEGLTKAEACSPDVVMTDLTMPVVDGLGFIRGFRADPARRRIPLLVLSSERNVESRIKAFELGANDYVSKPFHLLELKSRLSNYLRLKVASDELERANSELRRANERLACLASTDELTGLCNRRQFLTRAEEELARAERHNRPFGLLMIDVDYFKRINDRRGHPQGDRVLLAIARALRGALRRTDVVARFGGEEFVVLLPETGGDSPRRVAEKLRCVLRGLSIDGMGGDRVTVSIGCVLHPGTTRIRLDALLKLADAALYCAKSAGRDRVESAPGVAEAS